MSLDSPLVEGLTQEENEPQESAQEILYDKAARVIQRTWRKHTDIAVFKYFRSLMSFHNQGDPRLLLKYINPREADLLDAASGVYIRFRLGGTTFPPSIYYKIFTHRPIVDLCANSPKDYAHDRLRKFAPQQADNDQLLPRSDRSGWYQRVENNGWRLLCGKNSRELFTGVHVVSEVCISISLFDDPITEDTNDRRTKFHHCNIRRRQEVERKKKMRRIEWMKKMYTEGALQACTDQMETSTLMQIANQDMISAAEWMKDNSTVEWEMDELIAWTNALDFDEYINEWKHLGTSSSSMIRNDKQTVFSTHEFSQLLLDRGQGVTYIPDLPSHLSSLIKLEYLKMNNS